MSNVVCDALSRVSSLFKATLSFPPPLDVSPNQIRQVKYYYEQTMQLADNFHISFQYFLYILLMLFYSFMFVEVKVSLPLYLSLYSNHPSLPQFVSLCCQRNLSTHPSTIYSTFLVLKFKFGVNTIEKHTH